MGFGVLVGYTYHVTELLFNTSGSMTEYGESNPENEQPVKLEHCLGFCIYLFIVVIDSIVW